jgi:hypothetical protein
MTTAILSRDRRARLSAVAFLIAAQLVVLSAPASAASVSNGGFETGTLAGWTMTNIGTAGNWHTYSGTTTTSGPTFVIPGSVEGTWAAVSNQTSVGFRAIHQEVALEAGHEHTLTFQTFYRSSAPIVARDHLLHDTGQSNQHYRIDIMKPGTGVQSVAAEDVLQMVYRTETGAPASSNGWMPMTVDLTPWAGQTVRLRFAEVDNQLYFNAGLDDVKIVSTPNTVPASLDPVLTPATPDGDNGWYRSEVSIDWNIAGDPVPDVDEGCETGPFTNDGSYTESCTVSNGAGDPASASVEFNVDRTSPSVSVTGVSNGAQYPLGSVPAADCDTTDATSGVATAAVLAAAPDNTTIGFKSVQCVGAKDHAGNTADSSTVAYSVVYDATSILQPINPDGSSTFKLNSTIPVKIKLTGASAGTSGAVITQSVSKLSDNVWGDGLEGTSTATPHSGNQLRYDATNDQYIFNLATRPLGTGTFRVTLDLGGGKTETAQFSIVR